MTNKEKVSKKIRELVSSLMELSFGCELQSSKGTKIYWTDSWSTQGALCVDKNGWRYYAHESKEKNEIRVKPNQGDEFETFEIIGHPIHLEHVLRAVDKSYKKVSILENGNIMDEESKKACLYNLSKNFDNQSEPLYSFLADVLEV